ncbi:MAG: hypothetical protein KGL74_14115, partial [Elusimicrobia bacterium]|nr:hypothetical protein [Elusimicrobiota bacterium]
VGEEPAVVQAAADAKRGETDLPALLEKLKEYEGNRVRWPQFESFAPELAEAFGAAARPARIPGRDPSVGPSPEAGRDPRVGPNPVSVPNPTLGAGPGTVPPPPGFLGGIADALTDRAPCVLILPDSSAPGLAAALRVFRRERRLCDEELPGALAAGRNWSGKGVIAVGGPGQNAWVRRRWKELAVAPALAGSASFVAAERNPDDAQRPALLLAAPDAAPIPGLLRTFTGTGDYEVRDRSGAGKTGTYDKSKFPWRPN